MACTKLIFNRKNQSSQFKLFMPGGIPPGFFMDVMFYLTHDYDRGDDADGRIDSGLFEGYTKKFG